MADNLLTQSATPSTLSASVSLATEELADSSHAGVVVVADPADRAKMLKPNADGSLNVVPAAGGATEATLDARTGSLTEAAPATDTASSGISGRLQRLAQRLTTLLAVFPTTIAVNSGNKDASTLRVALATDQPILSTAFPSTARGTQGATGLATQDLKDSGRTGVTLVIDAYQVAATAETLINVMQSSLDNAANTTGLSEYEVPAGKTFRIESILFNLSTTTGNTTVAGVSVRIRTTTGGTVGATSPLQFKVGIGGVAAANSSSVSPVPLAIPDGWEHAAGHKIGVTVACPPYVVTTAAPQINGTIVGYLY